jgi:hypothetical protein
MTDYTTMDFSLHHFSHTGFGNSMLSKSEWWKGGSLSSGAKRLRLEANKSPSSNADAKID